MQENTYKFKEPESSMALIYFPDISGFTDFVNQTEINHSQLIIVDLLETIIEQQTLPFLISEIEGDAILYYKFGVPPSVEELVKVSKDIFAGFHKKLHEIIKYNHCSCNACRGAHKLSLKFIAHYGHINKINIGSFQKLFGRDLIIAHRLLKNSLRHTEYILLSENYLKAAPSQNVNDDKINIIETTEDLHGLSKINAKVILLDSSKN